MADWNELVLRNPHLRTALTNVFEGNTAIKPALQDVTPVNAVASQGTLTLSGVVIDGETVTIGSDVYEFCADEAQSLTTGSTIAVDIEAAATKSEGELSMATQPTAGDTITLDTKVFTFVALGTAADDGDVDVGADVAAAKVNLVAAINGTDTTSTAHTSVYAPDFVGDTCDITALVGGTAGDLIATTETFTDLTDAFDATTLGTEVAGVDCIASAAVTALVAAITASDTAGVGAADGAGDTVVLTADTKGVAGDLIATTEAMANGAFGQATLGDTTAGVNGTVGTAFQMVADSSYLYIAIAANTIAGANWRRFTVGSVY